MTDRTKCTNTHSPANQHYHINMQGNKM